MPLRNGIIFSWLAFAFLAFAGSAAEAEPLVIGYERFHREEISIEGGRLLFNELGCVNCHYTHTDLPAYRGPVLNGILQHKNPEWVRHFLVDPARAKPGTRMPGLGLSEEDAESVIHYLAGLKPEKKLPAPFRFTNAERGLDLYHEMGCVACHGPSEDYDGKAVNTFTQYSYPQLPFINLQDRYDQASLSAFLYRPYDFRPDGRMPRFKLDREDGGDIAAYLLDFHAGDSREYPTRKEFEVDSERALRGFEVVKQKNCSACHEINADDLPPYRKYPIAHEFLEMAEIPDHPGYNLSSQQMKSIRLFLEGERNSQAPVLSRLQALNCMACHERDSIGGPDEARRTYFTGNPDLGDSGRIPPPLTGIGWKLQPDWLREVLEGKNKIRPYVNTQMPSFENTVQGLADRLIWEDRPEQRPDFSIGDHLAGQKLLGTQGGLNCITCHHWGDRKSLGIQALDISTLAQRLNFDWFKDYLINPAGYRSNTLMPSFWPEGRASNRDILNGDTQAQIEAIYAFANEGEGIPEGFPEHNTADYEIVPTDRPVVQRSFMEGVGTHALLVGFPEGVHLAFDGASCRPMILWKGAFFDAYRTWFSRFPEFEKPLGTDIVHYPENPPDAAAHFQGYRLDSAGIPEFIIQMKGAPMYERFLPVKDQSNQVALQRTIRYTSEAQLGDPRLDHPEGVRVKEQETRDPMTRTFIYQW